MRKSDLSRFIYPNLSKILMTLLQTIDPLEHIRSHPQMYLPGGIVDPVHLATRSAGDALSLSANRVELVHENEWWIVRADLDWLFEIPLNGVCGVPGNPPVHAFYSIHEIFNNIVPIPQAGVNSFRSEILLTVFAKQVITAAGYKVDIIKPSDRSNTDTLPMLCKEIWCRTIAFRMD